MAERYVFTHPNATVVLALRVTDGKLVVEDGTLHSFGWDWHYGDEMPGLLFFRLYHSSVWSEFRKWLEENGIPANKVAELVAEDTSGLLYGASGDNLTWYFSEFFDSVEMGWVELVQDLWENNELSCAENKIQKVLDWDLEFWSTVELPDFDEFYNEFEKTNYFREDLKKLNDVEDYDDLEDAFYAFQEDAVEFLTELIEGQLWEALARFCD